MRPVAGASEDSAWERTPSGKLSSSGVAFTVVASSDFDFELVQARRVVIAGAAGTVVAVPLLPIGCASAFVPGCHQPFISQVLSRRSQVHLCGW